MTELATLDGGAVAAGVIDGPLDNSLVSVEQTDARWGALRGALLGAVAGAVLLAVLVAARVVVSAPATYALGAIVGALVGGLASFLVGAAKPASELEGVEAARAKGAVLVGLRAEVREAIDRAEAVVRGYEAILVKGRRLETGSDVTSLGNVGRS